MLISSDFLTLSLTFIVIFVIIVTFIAENIGFLRKESEELCLI